MMLRTDFSNAAAQYVGLERGEFVRNKDVYGFLFFDFEITRLRRHIWVYRPASLSI
jgi:hypothetical protein